MTFEEAKQQAIERSEWVLCHGAGYYTARTPDGRDIIGKGENGVFVGGEYRRAVKTSNIRKAKNISRTSRKITNLNFTKMVLVYDIGKSRWQADFGREALEFGRNHFTIDTGNYVITVDPKKYRIFDRTAGKPLVNGVVRIDEQDMNDILAAAPKSQRGWIRTRLGYMVVV